MGSSSYEGTQMVLADFPTDQDYVHMTDDFFRQLKGLIEGRLDQEHIWPATMTTDADEVFARGNHRPDAGRMLSIEYADLKADESYLTAKNDLGTVGEDAAPRAGALIQLSNSDGLSSGPGWKYSYCPIFSGKDGVFYPANIARVGAFFDRGLALKEGRPIYKNYDDNGLVFSDGGSWIPSSMNNVMVYGEVCQPLGNATKKIWPIRIYNAQDEHIWHFLQGDYGGRVNETLAIDLGNYGNNDSVDPGPGTRVEINKDGIAFTENNDGGIEPEFDGIYVKQHNHSGGRLGVPLTFNSITSDPLQNLLWSSVSLTPGYPSSLTSTKWVKNTVLTPAYLCPVPGAADGGMEADWLRILYYRLRVRNTGGTFDAGAHGIIGIMFVTPNTGVTLDNSYDWGSFPLDRVHIIGHASHALLPHSNVDAFASGSIVATPHDGSDFVKEITVYLRIFDSNWDNAYSIEYGLGVNIWRR